MGEVRRKAGRPAGRGLAVVLGRVSGVGGADPGPPSRCAYCDHVQSGQLFIFSVVGKVDSQVQKKSE